MPLVLQNQLYAKQSFVLVALHIFALAMWAFTSSGFLRSACALSCLRLYEIERIVFADFPELVAFRRVFIIRSSCFVGGCWGRSLANVLGVLASKGGILVPTHLEWSRIPAWGVGNLGSNPSDPTTRISFVRHLLGIEVKGSLCLCTLVLHSAYPEIKH